MTLRGEGDDDRDLDESEYPDAHDTDEFGYASGVATEPCPYCRRPVYEQAEVCPYCRNYLSREDSTDRKPLWIVIGVLICLAIVGVCWVL